MRFKKVWHEKILKTKLFFCPPRNIKHLFKKVRKHETAVDIDVDYMTEFQETCYTKAPRVELQGVDITSLGSINTITKAIQRIRPRIITISEIELSHIESSGPPIENLFKWLESKGFQIEIGELVENDDQAIQAIEKEENFHKRILPSVMKKHVGPKMSALDLKRQDKDVAAALKKYYLQ